MGRSYGGTAWVGCFSKALKSRFVVSFSRELCSFNCLTAERLLLSYIKLAIYRRFTSPSKPVVSQTRIALTYLSHRPALEGLAGPDYYMLNTSCA